MCQRTLPEPHTEISIVPKHGSWKLKWLTENLIKIACIIKLLAEYKIKLIQAI